MFFPDVFHVILSPYEFQVLSQDNTECICAPEYYLDLSSSACFPCPTSQHKYSPGNEVRHFMLVILVLSQLFNCRTLIDRFLACFVCCFKYCLVCISLVVVLLDFIIDLTSHLQYQHIALIVMEN